MSDTIFRSSVGANFAAIVIHFCSIGPPSFHQMLAVVTILLQNSMACKVFRMLKLQPTFGVPLNLGDILTIPDSSNGYQGWLATRYRRWGNHDCGTRYDIPSLLVHICSEFRTFSSLCLFSYSFCYLIFHGFQNDQIQVYVRSRTIHMSWTHE